VDRLRRATQVPDKPILTRVSPRLLPHAKFKDRVIRYLFRLSNDAATLEMSKRARVNRDAVVVNRKERPMAGNLAARITKAAAGNPLASFQAFKDHLLRQEHGRYRAGHFAQKPPAP
jgi:hypothetical protein